jgi:hypothetical protein
MKLDRNVWVSNPEGQGISNTGLIWLVHVIKIVKYIFSAAGYYGIVS